ncbi:hypothetical protein DPMN_006778 [Dreissena polymorpha]|uniref:Uncharacterized protein n=1 Tax=Dreissena polymorpha TaxID=45954 RepID=A0A9D4MUW4_DREPO|nr:hypothetical protein DPMN_006778 [Dreissena polymorpha]
MRPAWESNPPIPMRYADTSSTTPRRLLKHLHKNANALYALECGDKYIAHDWQMTPIDVQVIRSFEALRVLTVSEGRTS